jgi:small subunit ribosomal protein S20
LPKGTQKAVRVGERRRKRNRSVRRTVKTYVASTEKLIASGEVDEAKAMMLQATSVLDRAARKGVIHRNSAARRKSRLMKRLNQISGEQSA